tara:strand:+ start:12482 stop:13159 length:678 start_codon:yes stop_codon:yes gene_type:complete
MSSQSVPATDDRPPHHGLAYNMAGIAVLVLFLAVGLAYLIDDLGRLARAPVPTLSDGKPISQTMSGRELTIPTAWFRFGEQIRSGFTDQIDLRVMLTGADGTPVPVDVTLLPRSRARTSASLLDRVYLHQFTDETLGGVPGLIGKPMQDQNGYAGESVWYDALSPNPFVAKCLQAVGADGTQQCVRTVYLPGGMAAIYAFDAKILQTWRQFDPEMEQWLTRIGAF